MAKSSTSAAKLTGTYRDLAFLYLLLNEPDLALENAKKAKQSAKMRPLAGLVAAAIEAYLSQDSATFSAVLTQAQPWQDPSTSDYILAFWLRYLCESGKLSEALSIAESYPLGPYAKLELCKLYLLEDQTKEAQTLLDSLKDVLPFRMYKLHYLACCYLLESSKQNLDALLSASLLEKKLLPGLVPLQSLTHHQAELCQFYPLSEVLTSSWKEAIHLRQHDIPELELTLLGQFELRFMKREIELTERQKQILSLLTFGFSRDEVAEAMWPETDIKKQRNNLNVQLNLLRKVIEPWGVTTYLYEDGLRKVTSDYLELRKALDEGVAATVYKLYQEPLAAGVHLNLMIDLREQLREEVIDMLYEASLSEEAPAAYLTKLLELDPLHEEALQVLLKTLLARGRKREARRRYRKFAQQLEEDMGLTPLEATRVILET